MVRVVPRPTPSLAGPPVTARLVITPRLAGSEPHFEVSVRMTEPVDGKPPTGFAATLLAGWEDAPRSRLVHVRVTLEGVVVRNALKPVLPGVPTPPGWKLQANVDGEWQEIAGLEQVADDSEGRFFPVRALYDQFLRRDATLRLHADAASIGCLDTLFAHSLLEDFIRFGFNPADPRTLPGALRLGETCLAATERDPGAVDVTFDGPRFGAREAPYEIASRGGAARTCSTSSSRACTTDADCPAGETCDGAFKLRFRIERGEEERGEELAPVAALSGRGR